jgi:hypothetical protein
MKIGAYECQIADLLDLGDLQKPSYRAPPFFHHLIVVLGRYMAF